MLNLDPYTLRSLPESWHTTGPAVVAHDHAGLFELARTGREYAPLPGVRLYELEQTRGGRRLVVEYIAAHSDQDAIGQANELLGRWAALGRELRELHPAPLNPPLEPQPCALCGAPSRPVVEHHPGAVEPYRVRICCAGVDCGATLAYSESILMWAYFGALRRWAARSGLPAPAPLPPDGATELLTTEERAAVERSRQRVKDAIAARVAGLGQSAPEG